MHLCLLSCSVVDFLRFDGEGSRYGSMVRDVHFVALVVKCFHPRRITTAIQNPIAPCRNTPLLRSVVLVREAVIFISRGEGDWCLMEGAKSEAPVSLHLLEQLIVVEKVLEVAGFDVGNDRLSPLVDAIVEITIELPKVRVSGINAKEAT